MRQFLHPFGRTWICIIFLNDHIIQEFLPFRVQSTDISYVSALLLSHWVLKNIAYQRHSLSVNVPHHQFGSTITTMWFCYSTTSLLDAATHLSHIRSKTTCTGTRQAKDAVKQLKLRHDMSPYGYKLSDVTRGQNKMAPRQDRMARARSSKFKFKLTSLRSNTDVARIWFLTLTM